MKHAISATERDAIVAALKGGIHSIAEIAAAFNRSVGTVDKIRARNGLGLGGRR